MQISLKWINELIKIETIDLEKLIEKLTLGGFEVEEILEVNINNQKQTVLDISATANRPDSLSIYGISMEIAALFDQSVRMLNYTFPNKNWTQLIEKNSNSFTTDSDCSMFLAVIVENVTTKSSPRWMQQKLQSSGLVPSNNLIDFQNYILLETGYPIEIYDLEKIKSKLNISEFSLSFEKATDEEQFLANNDILYKLDNSILTLKANEISISIAGIIGAKNFSTCESTTTLLIEGSTFNAAQIRQQSKKLGLRTERSAKYQKSLKNTYLNEAVFRFLSLLRISNPNLRFKLQVSKHFKTNSLKPLLLRYDTIKQILGPIDVTKNIGFEYISPEKIEGYLKRLKFKFYSIESNKIWSVEIPPLRTDDITREIDLIEEIGRLHGFNNFLTTLPKISRMGNEDFTYKIRKKITACLLNLGLNEFIHYSLVNKTTFVRNDIDIINPIVSDYATLRISLLPSLLKIVQENLKQKNVSIEGFEYGHVFSLDSKNRFEEKEHLAGILGGIKTKIFGTNPENSISWFEAKGKIEQLFEQLNLIINWKPCSSSIATTLLHPYRSSEISLVNEVKLGIFGQIHPLIANQLNISAETYLFEFDIESIVIEVKQNKLKLYKPYSLYPKIIKDLSFVIQSNISFEKIRATLYLNGTQFLSEIILLDEYKGSSIPAEHKSLCLQLIFQSSNETLENKEIENIIKNFKLILTQKFNANIRN